MRDKFDGFGILLLAACGFLAMCIVMVEGIRVPPPAEENAVQASMAWASWSMVLLAAATSVVSLVSLYLLRLTWLEARRSADTTERALMQAEQTTLETVRIGEAQSRAYLVVTSSYVEFENERATIKYGVQNSGLTPASMVEFIISVEIQKLEELTWVLPGRPYHENKARSDIASGATKSAKSETISIDRFFDYNLSKPHTDCRVITNIRLRYTDAFGRRHDANSRYAAYFQPGQEKRLTLFKQLGEEGMDFDVFD